MRIYAKDNIDTVPTPFDEFVGKNIWVACYLGQDIKGYDFYFVRFLYKDVRKRDWIVFTLDVLSSRTLQQYRNSPQLYGDSRYDPEHARNFVDTRDYNLDYMSLVSPLLTVSTEKLFGFSDYSVNVPIIDKIVGKGYWVRAKLSAFGDCYVTFHKKINDTVICDYIDTKYVEGYTYDYYDEYPDQWLNSEVPLHIDAFYIYTPVDILTDTEVKDEYNAACSAYEEGYWADHDEEEDEEEDE